MAEIHLDADTNINDDEDSVLPASQRGASSLNSTDKPKKMSVVVKIPLEKLKPTGTDKNNTSVTRSVSTNSNTNSKPTVSTQKKQELLRKAKIVKEKLQKRREAEKKEMVVTPVVPPEIIYIHRN